MATTKTFFRRPSLERLETRLAPAVHTWTGKASDLWSDDANWDGGSPAGDPKAELVFPKPGGTNAGGFDVFNPPDLGEYYFEVLADAGGLMLRTTRG